MAGRARRAAGRLVGLRVGGVAFWLLTGAARSVFQPPVPPETSRYLTLGAVILLLAAVEIARGISLRPAVLVYAAMITLVAVALGCPRCATTRASCAASAP